MTVALITGGSSGLGRAFAIQLATHGVKKVFIVGRDSRKLEDVTSLYPDIIIPITADLSQEAGSEQVEKVLTTNHILHLDYLVHNAATETPFKSFREINLEEWRYAFSLNVESVFLLTKKLLSKFKFNSRILFLSSGFAYHPMQGLSAYCSSKAAFSMLGECLKIELKPQGIGVGVVLLGGIETEMQSRLREVEAKSPSVSGTFFRDLQVKIPKPEVVAEFLRKVLLNTEQHIFMDTFWDMNKCEELSNIQML